MKLVKTVVNSKINLIGFVVTGKASEFGKIGTGETEAVLDLNYMNKIKFKNKQVQVVNGCIRELGSFRLNQLDMVIYNDDGSMTNIDNSVRLTSRFVMNNENIGFGVSIGGTIENKFRYDDVIKLTELFKPQNFVIRYNDDGKRFIAGKPGSPLSALPAINLGDKSEAKRVKSTTSETTPVTGTRVGSIDILDIFDFVRSVNGFIIKLPGTGYVATGDVLESADASFKSFNIGEIATPSIDFNENKLNASCKFRNPGYLMIGSAFSGIGGMATAPTPVYTYIWRGKNVFFNGECHMHKLGIVIPIDCEKQLYTMFGKSMTVTPVVDENVIRVVNQLINWPNSKIFEVDISKLEMIAPSKYTSYILPNAQVKRYVKEVAEAKIIQKFCRGLAKELKEAGVTSTRAKKELAPQFKGKSKDELERLIDLGINVFDGSFTLKGETTKNVKSGTVANPEVEIKYVIDGMNPDNFTYKKMKDKPEIIPSEVAIVLNQINYSNPQEAYEKALELMDEYDKYEWKAKRMLWLHKASMWLQSGKSTIHKGDKAWVVNESSRMKGLVYKCTEAEAEGLNVSASNVSVRG